MIIHVSGTTGSGKTYLGKFVGAIYDRSKLLVVDLDSHLYSIINSKRAREIQNPQEKFQFIDSRVKQFIERLKQKYENILFVGYSDIVIGGKIYLLDLEADRKFFIQIPFSELLRQYKDRAGRTIIATRREVTILSESDLKKMTLTDRNLYGSKYKWMPQKEIIKEIILLIGN